MKTFGLFWSFSDFNISLPFFFYFPYSCPRSRESIEKSFWVFEGVTLLIGLVACMVVFVRRRKLNREAAERVRKQISNSAWKPTINDSTRTSLWTRPMKGMQYSDVNFVKEKLDGVPRDLVENPTPCNGYQIHWWWWWFILPDCWGRDYLLQDMQPVYRLKSFSRNLVMDD